VFVKDRLWLVIALLVFATAHVVRASMLAATSGTQERAPLILAHQGD
jgi:hypothetical protein